MNQDDLQHVLDAETEASEATRDEPMRAGRRRDQRSVVYSIRLHPDEAAAIQRLADAHGVPARGLVRGWVLQALAAETEEAGPVAAVVEALSRDVDRLRRALSAAS